MQTDLQSVTLEDGTSANFYFGDDGVMRTGKQTIFNEEDGRPGSSTTKVPRRDRDTTASATM